MITRTLRQRLKCFEQSGFDLHKTRAYDWLFDIYLCCGDDDMLTRRGAIAVGAVVMALSVSLVAQDRNQKPPNQPPKLSNAQKAELTAITQAVDAAAAGQTPPNDLSLTWAGRIC